LNLSANRWQIRAAKPRAMLLRDEEWQEWSDREIARRCAVGKTLVLRLREDLTPASGPKDQIGRKAKRGGKTYLQRTKNTSSAARRPDCQQTAYNH
jgi:hypothetical protein